MSRGSWIVAVSALIACACVGAHAGGPNSDDPGSAARQLPSTGGSRNAVSAPCKAPRHMKNVLKRLLDNLDEISQQHEEVSDTDVREQMHVAIRKGFIKPEAKYIVPSKFGMFSSGGDRRVREAIVKFLADPELAVVSKACQTPQARLDWFQDVSVPSSAGNTYDEYFGHAEEP